VKGGRVPELLGAVSGCSDDDRDRSFSAGRPSTEAVGSTTTTPCTGDRSPTSRDSGPLSGTPSASASTPPRDRHSQTRAEIRLRWAQRSRSGAVREPIVERAPSWVAEQDAPPAAAGVTRPRCQCHAGVAGLLTSATLHNLVSSCRMSVRRRPRLPQPSTTRAWTLRVRTRYGCRFRHKMVAPGSEQLMIETPLHRC
jgi:hypothetical protein